MHYIDKKLIYHQNFSFSSSAERVHFGLQLKIQFAQAAGNFKNTFFQKPCFSNPVCKLYQTTKISVQKKEFCGNAICFLFLMVIVWSSVSHKFGAIIDYKPARYGRPMFFMFFYYSFLWNIYGTLSFFKAFFETRAYSHLLPNISWLHVFLELKKFCILKFYAVSLADIPTFFFTFSFLVFDMLKLSFWDSDF